jgi:adenylate cyclase
MKSALKELVRRDVIRVGGAYLVAGWALLQVVVVLSEVFSLPDWTMRFVAIALGLGLPVVLVLAWLFELTPDGIRRDRKVDHAATAPVRRMDVFIIVMLALAVTLFVVDRAGWFEQPADSDFDIGESIAVLPFLNLSADATQDYFADGLTEELIGLLGRVDGLRVIGRTSSFRFKGQREDVRAIGGALGVSHLLDGSVRRAGQTMRVNAQLVSSQDGSQLWNASYDREFGDILQLQSDIGRAVVAALKFELLDDMPADAPTLSDASAYDLYLRGLRFRRLAGEAALAQAETLFTQATELDPTLALAWDGLAAVYVNQVMTGLRPASSGIPLAWKTTQRTLELDSQMASAHYAQGFIQMVFDFDWGASEASFRRALEIQPSYAGALSGIALLSAARGEMDLAAGYMNRSVALDPLLINNAHNQGFIAYLRRDYAVSEREFRRALEFIGGSYTKGNNRLSAVLLLQGRAEEALAVAAEDPGAPWRLAAESMALYVLGRRDESKRALTELESRFGERAAVAIAKAHAVRGESDQALDWLEQAAAQQDTNLAWVSVDPLLERVTAQPRFDALMARLRSDQPSQ